MAFMLWFNTSFITHNEDQRQFIQSFSYQDLDYPSAAVPSDVRVTCVFNEEDEQEFQEYILV
jgi:hypothetical protein